MSNEHDESRRKFLSRPVKVLPAVALASTGLGAVTTVTAQTATATAAGSYMPTYFQEEEWRFIQAAVDVLIPEDDAGPGAIIAGVPEFIDRQMETPYGHGRLWYMQGPFHPEMMRSKPDLGYQLNMNPRDIYRSGISELNAWCNRTHHQVFADLDKDTQVQVIKDLEGKKIAFSDDAVLASTFWEQLLSNTKEGFFADPIYGGNKNMVGWKMVGFPGARADFMDWIDHPNEPYPYGPVSISGEKA